MRPPCADKTNNGRRPWATEEDPRTAVHGNGNWSLAPRRAGNVGIVIRDNDQELDLWTADPIGRPLSTHLAVSDCYAWLNCAGLRRCGKSCKPRWSNYHQPDSKHEIFTPQEEELIIRLHVIIGSRCIAENRNICTLGNAHQSFQLLIENVPTICQPTQFGCRWSIIAQQLPGRTDNDVKNHWNTKLRKKLKEMGIDPVTHKPFSQVLRDYGNIGGTPRESRIGSADQPQAFSNLNTHQMPPKVTSRTETDTAQDNHSLDLLAQLQAIKLVTEASTCSAHGEMAFMPSDTSSSPPTSSSSTGSEVPRSVFSWSDFLIEDATLPAELSKEGIRMRPQNGEIDHEAREESNGTGGFHQNGTSNGLKGSSIPSSDGSFVESILSQSEEMFMEFPELWEEPLY